MYVRMQFMITEEQRRALRALARLRGVSMSQLLRDILDEALLQHHEALLERQRLVLEEARSFIQEIAGRYPAVPGEDIVQDIRTLRENRHVPPPSICFGRS